MDILIEVSAKHVHLSPQDIEALFGKGAALTVKRELSTPGYYVCSEKVQVQGPKGMMTMGILGPPRKKTQVEVSMSDAIRLGITPPLRESGDLKDSAGVVITGPCGQIRLKEGVIIAKRHIHLTPEEAARMGLKDSQTVDVKADGERKVVFGETIVRTDPSYVFPSMHIDTDEANAAGIKDNTVGNIMNEV